MKKMSVRNLVLMALLTAWAVVFRMIEIPLLPAAPFLKMDLSDFVVLIGLLVNGPIAVITIAVLRDLIWYFMTGGDMGIPIGEIMSIASSIAMFLPTYFILKKWGYNGERYKQIFAGIILIVSLTVTMSLINYYIALPIYTSVMNFPIDNFLTYVLSIIVPFNLIKGVIYAIGQIVVVTVLVPHLKKKHLSYL